MGHSIGVCQHRTGDTEDVAGNHIDERKCQHGCKCAAGALLCPAAADGNCEQDVQIIDNRPADVFHGGADGHNCRHVGAAHLHQLAQADHKTGSRHNGDNRHEHLAQLLQKIEIDESLFLGLLCIGFFAGRSCFRFLNSLFFFCQGYHLRLACLCGTFCTVQLHTICAASQNDGSDGFQAAAANQVEIHLCHGLTLLDRLSRFDENLKTLAVQADRFQAHMNQNLQPAVCRKANGVLGFRNHCYGAIYRAAKQTVRRLDGDTFTQNAAGKSFIRNFAQRNKFSVEGCRHDSRKCRRCHNFPPCYPLFALCCAIVALRLRFLVQQ